MSLMMPRPIPCPHCGAKPGEPHDPECSVIQKPFLYRYAWNRMGRKGQACAVLARGKMNSCVIKFEDGYTVVTSRNAVRRLVRAETHDR